MGRSENGRLRYPEHWRRGRIRGGAVLIVRDGRLGCGAGKRRQLLILGKARRCCPILARACEAHKAHLIERIVAAAKLDWKAALGYLNVNSRASFKTRDYDLRSLLLRIDKIES